MAQSFKISVRYLALILSLVAPSALPAEWTASAGVAPKLVYTDNVCLSPDDKQDDLYAIITPRGQIQGSGSRVNASLSASIDLNSLTNSDLENNGCGSRTGERDQYRPRLNARGDAVLVENWLYIDADASVSQNSVNPFATGGADDPEDRTGNTNTTARYSVSPYISRRFKDFSTLLLRYTYDDQYNSKKILRESNQQTVLLSLNSIPGASKFFWGLRADYDKVNYPEADGRQSEDSELASARISSGFQFNRSWQINGYVGNEVNDFTSFSNAIDGSFWDVGLRWTPNARTSVEVGTGNRFFGNTPRVSISHRHKRSLFSANYDKTLRYSRNIRTLDGSLPGIGEPGAPTTLSTSPILDERFSLGYRYTGRRSGLSISASHSDQTRTEDGRNAIYKDVSIDLNYSLSQKWSASSGLSWSETEPFGDNSEFVSESETWRAHLSAQRPLNSNTRLILRYQYTDRQSELARNEYTENRISVTINFSL